MPWAPFCAMVLPMWTMLSAWSKQSHGCSCPGCKATNHTGTLRNLLNPCLRSYTNTRRNSSEPSGTFRTLPLEPTPTRAGTLRNPPEPSKTFRNQPFGTFRNLPPTRTGTHRCLSGLKTPLAYAVGEKCFHQSSAAAIKFSRNLMYCFFSNNHIYNPGATFYNQTGLCIIIYTCEDSHSSRPFQSAGMAARRWRKNIQHGIERIATSDTFLSTLLMQICWRDFVCNRCYCRDVCFFHFWDFGWPELQCCSQC